MTIAQLSLIGQAVHPEAPIRFNRDSFLSVRRACGHYDLVGQAPGAYEWSARTDIECATCRKWDDRAWLDYIGDCADVAAEMAEA